MSKKRKSLQDLGREASMPYSDDLTLHYLKLYARGKLTISNGDAIRHLRRVGALDSKNQLSQRAQLTLKAIRSDAQNQKASHPKEKRTGTASSKRRQRRNYPDESPPETDPAS